MYKLKQKYLEYKTKDIQQQHVLIKYYNQIEQNNELYNDAQYYKGKVLVKKLRQYEDAIQCFDGIRKDYNRYTNVLYYKGIALYKLDEYFKALGCFDQIIQDNSKYSKVEQYKNNIIDSVYITHLHNTTSYAYDYILGQQHYKEQKYTTAIEYFSKIPPSYEQYYDVLYYKGKASYKENKYSEAIKYFHQIPPDYNKYYDVLYYKGSSYKELSKYTKAYDVLSKIPNTYHNYSKVEQYKNHAKILIQQYKEVIQEHSYNTEQLDFYIYLKDYKGAKSRLIEIFEEANMQASNNLVYNPYYPVIIRAPVPQHMSIPNNYYQKTFNYDMGVIAYKLKNYYTSIKYLDKIPINHAKYHDAQYYYIKALCKLSNTHSDINVSELSICLPVTHPKYYDAHYHRIKALCKLSNTHSDINVSELPICLPITHPKYYDALYYKGHSYYELCKYDLALISFLEIPETYKNFDALNYINSISYDKAQLYYNEKKYTEAIVHFTRVSSSYNKYYDALYYKGHSYYKLHKYDLALSCFQMIPKDHNQYQYAVTLIYAIFNSDYPLNRLYEKKIQEYAYNHFSINSTIQEYDSKFVVTKLLLKRIPVKNEGNHVIPFSLIFKLIEECVNAVDSKYSCVDLFDHMLTIISKKDLSNEGNRYYQYIKNKIHKSDAYLKNLENITFFLEKNLVPFIIYVWNTRAISVYHGKKHKDELKIETKSIHTVSSIKKELLNSCTQEEYIRSIDKFREALILSLDLPPFIKQDFSDKYNFTGIFYFLKVKLRDQLCNYANINIFTYLDELSKLTQQYETKVKQGNTELHTLQLSILYGKRDEVNKKIEILQQDLYEKSDIQSLKLKNIITSIKYEDDISPISEDISQLYKIYKMVSQDNIKDIEKTNYFQYIYNAWHHNDSIKEILSQLVLISSQNEPRADTNMMDNIRYDYIKYLACSTAKILSSFINVQILKLQDIQLDPEFSGQYNNICNPKQIFKEIIKYANLPQDITNKLNRLVEEKWYGSGNTDVSYNISPEIKSEVELISNTNDMSTI